jgi:hypothetical protein
MLSSSSTCTVRLLRYSPINLIRLLIMTCLSSSVHQRDPSQTVTDRDRLEASRIASDFFRCENCWAYTGPAVGLSQSLAAVPLRPAQCKKPCNCHCGSQCQDAGSQSESRSRPTSGALRTPWLACHSDSHCPSVTIIILAQPRKKHASLTASQWVSPSPSAAASRDAAASMVASAGKSAGDLDLTAATQFTSTQNSIA